MTMTDLITLQPIDGEPCVLDTDLAERLGMTVPRKVRQNVIEANREELEALGALRMQRIQTGGRPRTAYYLNEEQALLVCTLSRTEKAKLVRAMLIKVFMAWRRGELVPAQQQPQFAIPQTYSDALRLAADENEKRMALEAQVAEQAPKVETFDRFIDADGSYTTEILAKQIGFSSAKALNAKMHADGLIFPRKNVKGEIMYWIPRSDLPRPFYQMKTFKVGRYANQQLRWTPEGAVFLQRTYGQSL